MMKQVRDDTVGDLFGKQPGCGHSKYKLDKSGKLIAATITLGSSLIDMSANLLRRFLTDQVVDTFIVDVVNGRSHNGLSLI